MNNKLTNKELDEVLNLAAKMIVKYPQFRIGQSFFNSLYELHPQIADEVRATEYDPFYNDDKIHKCIAFISE